LIDQIRDIRLECLKLACASSRDLVEVEERAKRFVDFVMADNAEAPAAEKEEAERQTGDNQATGPRGRRKERQVTRP